jgi:hypothetical protein
VKRTFGILLLVVVASLGAGAAEAASRIDHRQARQHARIRQGWNCGELTRAERARLAAGQRMVRRMEIRAKADGFVSAAERRRIERAQDHESRAIARLKHNRRARA